MVKPNFLCSYENEQKSGNGTHVNTLWDISSKSASVKDK